MEKALQLVFSQQVRDVTADAQSRKVPALRPACVEAALQAKANIDADLRANGALHSYEESPSFLYNSNKAKIGSALVSGTASSSSSSSTASAAMTGVSNTPARPSGLLTAPGNCAEALLPQNSPSVLLTGANRRPKFSGSSLVNNTMSSAAAGDATACHMDPTSIASASAAKPNALLKSLAESPEIVLPNSITFDSKNSSNNNNNNNNNGTGCAAGPLLGVSDSSDSIDSSADEDADKKKLLLSDSGESKEEKATFFKAKPRLGEFTPLIEWLLHCGEAGEITMPSTVMEDGTEKASTMFSEDYIMKLCAAATQVLVQEPTLLELEVHSADTLIVVGDIHGQFQDLYTSVLCQQYDHHRRNPEGADRHFLFMGDYVDRGPHSLEVVLLLLALKVEYPTLVYLTRGNHEEEKTSRVYGFLTEATSSLGAAAGQAVWSAVNKVFLDLPLSALVTTPRFRFLVMHGGLSPALQTVEQIAAIDRHSYNTGELTKEAHDIVDGLLWSDPAIGIGCFGQSARGCGWSFGPTASNNFCTKNRLNFICRAHQLAMDGYFWTHNDRVVTVFSAPNYCGINDNRGAVMVVSGNANKPSFDQYEYYEDEMEYGGCPTTDFPYSSYFC